MIKWETWYVSSYQFYRLVSLVVRMLFLPMCEVITTTVYPNNVISLHFTRSSRCSSVVTLATHSHHIFRIACHKTILFHVYRLASAISFQVSM